MVMKPPPLPPIRGLEPVSLTAWEGRVAAVISIQGCNFDCPACPVPHLVPMRPELGTIPAESVLESIYFRRRWLDAVVVSGGEPTLHEGLPDLVRLLNEFGLRVRLATNGSRPEMLSRLLGSGDLTSVSMTVRAPLDPVYSIAAGTKVRLAAVYESVELLLGSPGEHEFRIPWLPGVVETEQMESVVRMLAGARRVVLAPAPDGSPGVRELRRVGRSVGTFVESCVVLGRPSEDFGSVAESTRLASKLARQSEKTAGRKSERKLVR
jgi:pyruvate formate lyase activating enzyme